MAYPSVHAILEVGRRRGLLPTALKVRFDGLHAWRFLARNQRHPNRAVVCSYGP